VRLEADARGAGPHGDLFTLQNLPDGVGHVRILVADQSRPLLDDRHLGSEAAVHLAELEADVAAADDHQVAGHVAEGQD
jgi:hypothetical protein